MRAYRLYRAGSAMCFERGWLALYQLLVAKPQAPTAACGGWAANCDYPFTRAHLLGGAASGSRG